MIPPSAFRLSPADLLGYAGNAVINPAPATPRPGTQSIRRTHCKIGDDPRGVRAMTTAAEYARSATAALHQALHIRPGDLDDTAAAALIERTIRNATRERDTRARRQLQEQQAASRARLAQLLRASPAV